jgi:hypothetical protein
LKPPGITSKHLKLHDKLLSSFAFKFNLRRYEAGTQLATGVPTGNLPRWQERAQNYEILKGGRYATAADEYG